MTPPPGGSGTTAADNRPPSCGPVPCQRPQVCGTVLVMRVPDLRTYVLFGSLVLCGCSAAGGDAAPGPIPAVYAVGRIHRRAGVGCGACRRPPRATHGCHHVPGWIDGLCDEGDVDHGRRKGCSRRRARPSYPARQRSDDDHRDTRRHRRHSPCPRGARLRRDLGRARFASPRATAGGADAIRRSSRVTRPSG